MPAETIEGAAPPRAGEELDGAALGDFLRRVDPSLRGAPEILQFSGGASNLTYLLRFPGRDLVLRRPPKGAIAKSAHDMLREARIMRAIRPFYPYAPQVVAMAEAGEVMETPFFVMERIAGVIPRRDLPPGLALSAEDARRQCFSLIDRLIELHRIDVQAAGLGWIGKGEGYVGRQISGWSERYRKAATPDVGDCEAIMAWLAAKAPPGETAICIIHNDFKFDNVVLDPADPFKVIGVLDWEMATLGDPLMELGSSLAYWIEANDPPALQALRRQPTHLPGMLTRQEVVAYYGARTGLGVANFDFYRIYGLFRLAVIAQQIYFRFFHGQTRNPQFAGFGQLVKILEAHCRDLIAKSPL